jgi:hypothetical protein
MPRKSRWRAIGGVPNGEHPNHAILIHNLEFDSQRRHDDSSDGIKSHLASPFRIRGEEAVNVICSGRCGGGSKAAIQTAAKSCSAFGVYRTVHFMVRPDRARFLPEVGQFAVLDDAFGFPLRKMVNVTRPQARLGNTQLFCRLGRTTPPIRWPGGVCRRQRHQASHASFDRPSFLLQGKFTYLIAPAPPCSNCNRSNPT